MALRGQSLNLTNPNEPTRPGFPAQLVDLSSESTVVLYPSDSAVTIADLSREDLEALRHVVVVDAKWTKTVGALRRKSRHNPCVRGHTS